MTVLADQKIIFAGTPVFSAAFMQGLINAGVVPQALYCQPDQKTGRGKKLKAPPTKSLALDHNIPVFQPINFKSTAALAELNALQADLMIIVAYGIILPQTVLSAPRLGCINVHASTLPRWRGAAPIERAIEAQDPTTGVTIMQMDAGLDTGPMLSHEAINIGHSMTGDDLREAMLTIGVPLLIKTLDNYCKNQIEPEIQNNELATYADKLRKGENAINWQLPAAQILAKINAFNSHFVCFTHHRDERVKIWRAQLTSTVSSSQAGTIMRISKAGIEVACSDVHLLITDIQLPGGKALSIQALLNGKPGHFSVGQCFA